MSEIRPTISFRATISYPIPTYCALLEPLVKIENTVASQKQEFTGIIFSLPAPENPIKKISRTPHKNLLTSGRTNSSNNSECQIRLLSLVNNCAGKKKPWGLGTINKGDLTKLPKSPRCFSARFALVSKPNLCVRGATKRAPPRRRPRRRQPRSSLCSGREREIHGGKGTHAR
ncbi:hypothetical protein R5R35_013953 [Gryllus longicercus]|uniref:Uncharacterized protein n=1 Tax=Gryllus longicercus TaxID=2509291 RepID=A0AAN9Z3C8_9ORTH